MKTFCLSSLLLIFVIGTSKADTFTFVPDGRPLTIYVDEEPPSVVQCALTTVSYTHLTLPTKPIV